jgi:putative SOS response-associated peptidase YedK
MCGRYGRDIPWPEVYAAMNLVRPSPTEAPNMAPEWDIRPTTSQWIARKCDDGMELVKARWGLIPFWHRGGLKDFKLSTFNARSETAATAAAFKGAFARRRCLVPASCWFEWTGDKGAKTKWGFTSREEPWFCFAGIWDRCATPDAGEVHSFTILTKPSEEPLRTYHHRAPVIVARKDWHSWLDVSGDVMAIVTRMDAADFVVQGAS